MKTKIIATIHWRYSLKKIKDIVSEGAGIIRINTKYTPFEEYPYLARKVRKAKAEIMIDFKDRRELKKIAELDFDYLAVSFSESEEEILKIKGRFPEKKIISKIESKKGVSNADSLIRVSYGIMIARGDLGRDIAIEKIPFIQRTITRECKKKKKMSILATEIMPSMVKEKRPTRAEVSDIANAILEGNNALLLAQETAIGKYPELAVKTLKKVIKETEKEMAS